jgi:putative spermidine/putrescine transport system permease protein
MTTLALKKRKKQTVNVFSLLGLLIFMVFFIAPLINLALWAFTDEWRSTSLLPNSYGLKWWSYVLKQEKIVSSISLSFMIATITTIVSAVICIPAAYAFSRIKFPFRRFFMFSFLLTNAFPKMGLYVSIAYLFFKLGLMNTLIGVIIIHLLNTLMYMTWIPSSSFRNVHKELEEAARDVGAGPIRTFFTITLPMALPGILVACIFTFLASLNESQGTFLVGVPDFMTMPVIMYSIVADYPVSAGAVFSIILSVPTVLLIGILRKYSGNDALAKGFSMK